MQHGVTCINIHQADHAAGVNGQQLVDPMSGRTQGSPRTALSCGRKHPCPGLLQAYSPGCAPRFCRSGLHDLPWECHACASHDASAEGQEPSSASPATTPDRDSNPSTINPLTLKGVANLALHTYVGLHAQAGAHLFAVEPVVIVRHAIPLIRFEVFQNVEALIQQLLQLQAMPWRYLF